MGRVIKQGQVHMFTVANLSSVSTKALTVFSGW